MWPLSPWPRPTLADTAVNGPAGDGETEAASDPDDSSEGNARWVTLKLAPFSFVKVDLWSVWSSYSNMEGRAGPSEMLPVRGRSEMIIHLFLKSKNPMAMVLYQYGVPTFLQQRNYNFSGEGVTQKVMKRDL